MGFLGGVDSGVLENGVCEKLDLGTMIDELDLCKVPPVFICVISLDPISPVNCLYCFWGIWMKEIMRLLD